MPTHSFATVEEGFQHLTDRIDTLVACVSQHSAEIEILRTMIESMVETHPDPRGLQEAWTALLSITLGNGLVHDGQDPAKVLHAEELARWSQDLTKMVADRAKE